MPCGRSGSCWQRCWRIGTQDEGLFQFDPKKFVTMLYMDDLDTEATWHASPDVGHFKGSSICRAGIEAWIGSVGAHIIPHTCIMRSEWLVRQVTNEEDEGDACKAPCRIPLFLLSVCERHDTSPAEYLA